MNPREALNYLDNIASQVQAPRNVHLEIQAAFAVLNILVEKSEEKAESETNNGRPASSRIN